VDDRRQGAVVLPHQVGRGVLQVGEEFVQVVARFDQVSFAARSLAGTVHTPPRRGVLAGVVGRVKGMFAK
jgi:hypothetical protein